MIIVLKQDAPDAQVREFCHELQDMGLQDEMEGLQQFLDDVMMRKENT